MKTVSDHYSAEITVKRSRFIADIFFVENEQDVKDRVKEIKTKYYDAKHHCYAYVKEVQRQLKEAGSNMELIRELMEEYKQTQELRNALARQRGSDVIV